MKASKPLKITETVLRDGHQSQTATRMRTADMLPVLEQLDEVGYHSLEAWGGATFDACLRFLDEDPWQRLQLLRSRIKKTPLQMLLRGQNILGYVHYADDVVSEFIKRSVDGGIQIIRLFDALNDVRNLEISIRAAKQAGAHVQCALVYTVSPYHNLDNYLNLAAELVSLGADSICIKDMAGLLLPYSAYQLVKALKLRLDVPIQLHAHYTSGVASMTYIKAIEAGVDIVDCALSPFALAPSQPATEAVIAALEGQERDTGLKKEQLYPIADHFRMVKKDIIDTFNIQCEFEIDTKVLAYQIPGGMLSNLLAQMKEQGMADKYQDLINEIPRVRAELGFPPLVTPTSQIVASMAAFNVMLGRYKLMPREVKDLVRGKYGRTPAPVDEKIRELILGDGDAESGRSEKPLPQLPVLAAELAGKGYPQLAVEDVLSYALFPDVALEFFKRHR